VRIRLLPVVLAVAVAGCGGSASSSSSTTGTPPEVSVALDFTPNPAHAPLYAAVSTGADRRAGVRLTIRAPGSGGPDSLRLVTSGRVDLGILDIQDLAIAEQRGVPVVGIAALVGRPLAALVAAPDVHRPRDLEGRTVGVSGLPSDPAFVRGIVEHDGGDVSRVREVTIGFNAVPQLLSHRVAAVPAFWNAEGVALRLHGFRPRIFRVERYGAPRYPEVVLIASKRELAAHRNRIARALRAIAAGAVAVRRDPSDAVNDLARVLHADDTRLLTAQTRAILPAFAPGLRLNRAVLERWARWDARVGILPRPPDVAKAFDFTMAPAPGG
jgi:NitT/TauT family transport system substrate-binding protein/putative hydroxymethylpyrimidine transport system substrate-binding protein